MNIGENDWLAQEYRREGRSITPEAARRLAKEHLLECDSHRIRQNHREECAADALKHSTRKAVLEDGASPGWDGVDWNQVFRKIGDALRELNSARMPEGYRKQLPRRRRR